MASRDLLPLTVAYRSAAHKPLLDAMFRTGLAEECGLTATCQLMTDREKARDVLTRGTYDVVSGNHHNLYAWKEKGLPFIHLAQTTNTWGDCLVARKGITEIAQLKGKRIGAPKIGSHTELNVWLLLKKAGIDTTRGDAAMVEVKGSLLDAVREGKVEAAIVHPPEDILARRAGLNVVETPSLPMVRGVTLTTTTTYVRAHEEQIRRLVKLTVMGIHFVKTQREKMQEFLSDYLQTQDPELIAYAYRELADSLEVKPYPSLPALENVFALAVRKDPEIAGKNPLIMWDLHYVRELDDSGFIDRLYAKKE